MPPRESNTAAPAADGRDQEDGTAAAPAAAVGSQRMCCRQSATTSGTAINTSTCSCNTSTTAVVHPTTSSPSPSAASPRLRPAFLVTLKFEEVVYKVRLKPKIGRWWRPMQQMMRRTSATEGEKTILNGMTGVVYPGEMLAMLGPSGSGKTTLLTALGGRGSPCQNAGGAVLSGKITYNGQQFSGSMKRRTGFVAQDDVLYPHLTVAETLYYTAMLRLPKGADKRSQAEGVMLELGLARVAHSMIGGVRGVRGLSGGERKRVSIGLEMMVDPSLLLLDEPTSGLDSTTAARIIATLRRMAVEGKRTVAITIHQPSSRLYHMFDKVLLLSADGWPIYYGPAADALSYFASIGFASPLSVNPADLMLDLANGIAPQGRSDEEADKCQLLIGISTENEQKAIKDKLVSAYESNIAPRLKAELRKAEVGSFGYNKDVMPNEAALRQAKRGDWTTSWWEQFRVLLSRGLKERRHESFNKLRIFQVLSVAILGGLLWWNTPPSHIQDRTALMFFFSVFWGFFPLYNAVFTFPVERPMLIKERSSGMYHLSSYFVARTVADLPMELGLPTAFVVILYWMGGLKPDAISFLLSLFVVLYSVLVAQSLGLAVGALLMDVKQGTTLASVITMVFLIAGGYYVQHIPPFISWLKYLSYSFYCYRLLLGVQFNESDYYECSDAAGHVIMCPVTQFPAIKAVGLSHLWVDACVMALMLVGYRLVAYLSLHRLSPR